MKYKGHFHMLPVILLVVISMVIQPGCLRSQWRMLYNGQDLEGWSVKCLPEDNEKAYWKTMDGYIECNAIGDPDHSYSWLVTEEEFDNFHLKLKFQVFRESPGNSGVQFRSRYDESVGAPNGGWMNGPQVDIHGPDPKRVGLIYDETVEQRRWIWPSLPDWRITDEQFPSSALLTTLVYFEDDADAWNTLEIICNGMLVQTIVNGNLVADLRGDGLLDDRDHQERNVGSNGCIALQLHEHDQLRIRFKEIMIRNL